MKRRKTMKMKGLNFIHSTRDYFAKVIIYDQKLHKDLEDGISIEEAIEKYPEREVYNIEPYQDNLVIIV